MASVYVTGNAPVTFLEELTAALISRFGVTIINDATAIQLRIDSAASQTLSDGTYQYRAVLHASTTVEEIADDINNVVLRYNSTFVSTRGSTTTLDGNEQARFLSVVRDGLAVDGGLFLPRELRSLPVSQIRYLVEDPSLTYHSVAQLVLERLVDNTQLSPATLASYIEQAYSSNRWGASDVCPLTPLHWDGEVSPGWDTNRTVHVLELFHGPTAAFKDFALQLFPYLFTSATAGQKQKYMILAATSGDTGVAAIVGFLNSSPDSKVMVLYPNCGVSPVQRVQMISTDDGQHVRVFGADSDFDFCQNTVKTIFRDHALTTLLRDDLNLTLSSANSINYGRLIPQVVYYFWAYRQLLQKGAIKSFGEPFDVSVPSGNFGNLLSCFIAKKMGLPVRKMILASNVNDVLYEFISTGVYDISKRTLQPTASPSIDILKASNIERLLYFLLDGNTEAVAQHMHDLDAKGSFTLTQVQFEIVKESFWAMRCTEDECRVAIRDVFVHSDKQRIVDPHTAVGVHAIRRYREAFPDESAVPMVLASTAHWAKFPGPILRALEPEHPLLERLAVDNDVTAETIRKCYTVLEELARNQPAHFALDAAVTKALNVEHAAGRTAPRDVNYIVEELKVFAKVA
ncbi:threonine synthase, putative [Bodo saltans]|uniref:threonine synthase n=1 Tax=Bodo saltans TaxID=75058 RepID=A0A0S4ITY7_BODSA|nr:threonine synthase, putative [Bodo saltans]|eukprot:CUF26873.1 threonine synthase, putative [Bodo saltans]